MRVKVYMVSFALILMGSSATMPPDGLGRSARYIVNEAILDISEFAEWKCGETALHPGETYESVALRVMGSTTHGAALAALNVRAPFPEDSTETWQASINRPIDRSEVALLPPELPPKPSDSRTRLESRPTGRYAILAKLGSYGKGMSRYTYRFMPATAIDFPFATPSSGTDSIMVFAIPVERMTEAMDFLANSQKRDASDREIPEWILRTESIWLPAWTHDPDPTSRIVSKFRLRKGEGNALEITLVSAQRFDDKSNLVTWTDEEIAQANQFPPNLHYYLFGAAGVGLVALIATWFVRRQKSLN